jgi:hypothetical protein
MSKIQNLTMIVLLLLVGNAWGAGFLDDFNRSNGELGNDWSTQTDGTIEVLIVDNEVLIAGEQATDWVRSGLSRDAGGETIISFDFKADDSFNVHIRIDDADTAAYIDFYAWPGGPFSYAAPEDGSWPGWTEISGSNMIAGEYNTLVLEQFGTEFMYTLNGVVIGTITNAELRTIGNVLISCDSAAGTVGSLHIDNVQIGFVDAEKARDPIPENGAIHPDTWVSLSWSPGVFAVSHDIYFSDNLADVESGAETAFQGNQAADFLVVGFPGMPYPDGLVNGTTYYWRVDEVNEADPNSPWKGNIWSFTVPPKTAYAPDPADGAESVYVTVKLRWTPGYGAKLHTVYFGDNFDDVNNATGGQAQGTTTYTPVGPLKKAKTYYWRVDEFDIAETHKGDVWSFITEGAVSNPNPSNGALNVSQSPILTWSPGIFGTSYEVYFGTDATSLELKGSGDLGSERYDPGQLEWNTTYYWRVDEASNANADSPWTGPLWSFATANFLVLDDMENYNDIEEGQPGSNRIYLAWVDGFDNPAINGSIVGHANAPFAEQLIVHGGNQSMPFSYDNAVGKSEATLTLTSNRDWTFKGINTLTIWFRGSTGNAAENMYVALNDTAVVNHENPNAARVGSWTEWNIDLTLFADQGIDLTNVNSITIGFGNRNNPTAGGAGMMYFDDIRLYAR